MDAKKTAFDWSKLMRWRLGEAVRDKTHIISREHRNHKVSKGIPEWTFSEIYYTEWKSIVAVGGKCTSTFYRSRWNSPKCVGVPNHIVVNHNFSVFLWWNENITSVCTLFFFRQPTANGLEASHAWHIFSLPHLRCCHLFKSWIVCPLTYSLLFPPNFQLPSYVRRNSWSEELFHKCDWKIKNLAGSICRWIIGCVSLANGRFTEIVLYLRLTAVSPFPL